jgi:hypothetical protein
MQYPTIPMKVYKLSSLDLLHETTVPSGGTHIPPSTNLQLLLQLQEATKIPLDNHLKSLCVNTPPHFIEHEKNNVNVHATYYDCHIHLKILERRSSVLLHLRVCKCSHPRSHGSIKNEMAQVACIVHHLTKISTIAHRHKP